MNKLFYNFIRVILTILFGYFIFRLIKLYTSIEAISFFIYATLFWGIFFILGFTIMLWMDKEKASKEEDDGGVKK